MNTSKSAYTQLNLSFRNENTKVFNEFIAYTTHRAGALINPEMIQVIPNGDNHTEYVITGSANDIYMFGYDWALWQFPPSKQNN